MINLPKEYLDDLKNILKDEFDEFLNSYEKPSYKGFRINTLKGVDVNSLPFTLSRVPWCNIGYYYSDSDHPGKHVYHDMGLYYIQEPSAMSVVEALDVKENDLVLDLCAAPGGKSTHIATKLNESGLLVSNEIINSRSKILSANIERFGIKNCIVLNEEPKKLKKRFKNFFNKIVVDAPCSGEGMFRKNNEAILEWNKDNVLMCAKRQKEILDIAKDLLQENGRIVYSTCTFSKEENEDVILDFLELNKEFKLVESYYHFKNGIGNLDKAQRLYPHLINGEGHFFAILERGDFSKSNLKLEEVKSIKQNQDFIKFVKSYLNINIEYNICFGDNLYKSPIGNLDGLKVQRCGLHLGEALKNRFEPSHSLCLALKKEDFKNIIELKSDDAKVEKYLRGESLESNIKGWGAIIVDGYPLGWFKGDGNIAKNHYPKGLRKM